ncbi:MAG TPA: hypothetical protein VL357_02210 [Rariglobus sp.]|jgi:hypothetical protein|nr:hypothetical protein [Rariglobus sp.]
MDFSKEKNTRFNPLHPAYKLNLWTVVETNSKPRLYVYWKRLGVFLAVLAITGWLSITGAAWAYSRYHQGFVKADYWMIAMPWRWQEHRQALGRFYLEQAPKEFEKADYATGLAHLRIGVTRIPQDLAGRQMLARAFNSFGRPELAINSLEDGLKWGSNDIEYLKLLFALLFQVQDDKRALDIATRILPKKPDDKLPHLYTALQAATAHYYRGNYDQAEQIIKQWDLGRSLNGPILLAKIDWERGYQDAALQRLEEALKRFGPADPLVLQLIWFYRETGQNDKATEYVQLRRISSTDGPGPRIDLLYSYYQENKQEPMAQETEAFISTYAHDHLALLMLAWFGADTCNVALTQRVRQIAAANGYSLNGFTFALVQAQLTAQNYQAALTSAIDGIKAQRKTQADFNALLSGLESVALFANANGQDASLQLKSFLSQNNLRATDAVLLARQLRLVNASSAARDVLTNAIAVDSLNQAALTDLVHLDAETDNRSGVVENLPKLIAMRKPSRAVLEESLMTLDPINDAALFQQTKLALANSSRQQVSE